MATKIAYAIFQALGTQQTADIRVGLDQSQLDVTCPEFVPMRRRYR